MENREQQIFDETQEKQAKFLKKYFLFFLCGIGIAFTLAAIVLFCLDIAKEIPIVFLSIGLFMIVLGIILYFVIPTKYNYDKFKTRVQKLGGINVYEMSAKIAELEERIATLENKDQ